MSIPSPQRKGEVIYIPQEEGAPAVTSLTRRPGGQGHRVERRAQVVFCRACLTAVWGVGHQEEPFFLVRQIVRGTSLPLLHLSLHCHLPSHPGAAAGQPLDLSARALFLQLGAGWLPAAHASSLCAFPPPIALLPLFSPPLCISPSGMLAGHLHNEAEALGGGSKWLPFCPCSLARESC